MRGLLQEVDTKLLHDIPEMVYDEVLMSHLIDELLLFEQELRTILHYPPSYPSPLHVMLEDVPFHKWLTLEKTCRWYVFSVSIGPSVFVSTCLCVHLSLCLTSSHAQLLIDSLICLHAHTHTHTHTHSHTRLYSCCGAAEPDHLLPHCLATCL